MKSKSKIKFMVIIAIASVLALMSVIAIIAIFAANKQTVLSNISVVYEADKFGVSGTVSAKYFIGSADETGTSMTTTGLENGEKTLTFAPSEETRQNTLNPQGTIQLTKENNFVVFEYKFTNTNSDIKYKDKLYMATLTFKGTADNVTLTSATSETNAITSFSTIEDAITNPTDFKFYISVQPNQTMYGYIKVQITNITDDASFNGDFKWDLNLDNSEELDKIFKFRETATYCSISGLQDDFSSPDLVIPTYYKGKPVTVIADAAFKGKKMFLNLTIPETLTTIHDAFSETSLANIYFTGNLRTWCELSLKGLNNLLNSKRNLYTSEKEGYKLIQGELIIPDDVSNINEYAFYGTPITRLVIGNNVTSIGANAFRECSYLGELTLGRNITNLGGYAFYNCANITKIYFNSISLTSETASLVGCGTNVDELQIIFSKEVTKISSGIFSNNNYPKIKILDLTGNITSIEQGAFKGCKVLEKVTIGEKVTLIDDDAFRTCTALNEVVLDSEIIYKKITSATSNGYLLNYLQSGTGKLKVLADIDSGNDYLTEAFSQGEQEEINGQMYNVYTKN